MKTFRILSIALLLINGFGAFISGYALVTDPSGSSLLISRKWLQHTPFNDYYIPGMILLCTNGIFDFIVLGFTVIAYKYYATFITIQGFLVVGWILFQAYLLHQADYLHMMFGIVGVLLIIFGILLAKSQKSTPGANMFWSYFRESQ
jgi:hypothetical protein